MINSNSITFHKLTALMIVLVLFTTGCLGFATSSDTGPSPTPAQEAGTTDTSTSTPTETSIATPSSTPPSIPSPTSVSTQSTTNQERSDVEKQLLYFKKKDFAEVYVESLEERNVHVVDYQIHLQEDELTVYYRWNETDPEKTDAELIQLYGFNVQGFDEDPAFSDESIISRANLVAVKENRTVQEVRENLANHDEFLSGYILEEWGRQFANDELHPLKYLEKFALTSDDPDRYPPSYR